MRSSAVQKESGITDKQAHERLMYLLGAAIVNMTSFYPCIRIGADIVPGS